MKIVSSRPDDFSAQQREVLESAGHVVLHVPATQIIPTTPTVPLALTDFEVIAMMSPRAVAAAWELLEGATPPPVMVVGKATARAATDAGFDVRVVVSETAEMDSLAGELATRVDVGSCASIGARAPRPEFGELLSKRGILHHHYAVYATEPLSWSDEQSEVVRTADLIIVGAPSQWAVVRQVATPTTPLLTMGTTTAGLAREDGFHTIAAKESEWWAELLRFLALEEAFGEPIG